MTPYTRLTTRTEFQAMVDSLTARLAAVDAAVTTLESAAHCGSKCRDGGCAGLAEGAALVRRAVG